MTILYLIIATSQLIDTDILASLISNILMHTYKDTKIIHLNYINILFAL